MHLAAHYMAGLFPAKVKRVIVEAYILTPADAGKVRASLPVDANNERQTNDAGRFQRVLAAVVGKRLTYRVLTAQNDAGFMGIK